MLAYCSRLYRALLEEAAGLAEQRRLAEQDHQRRMRDLLRYDASVDHNAKTRLRQSNAMLWAVVHERGVVRVPMPAVADYNPMDCEVIVQDDLVTGDYLLTTRRGGIRG